MKQKLLFFNHIVLLLCASIYLGTGVSLVFFSLPIAPQLTPENYYLQVIPQTEAATHFFTTMTILMLILCVVMTISEWRKKTRWVPIATGILVIIATILTKYWIFPINHILMTPITDPIQLQALLEEWVRLNRIRSGIWVLEWVTMVCFFIIWAYKGRYAE